MLDPRWYDKIAASQEEAEAIAAAAAEEPAEDDKIMEDIAIAQEVAGTNLPTDVKVAIMEEQEVDPEIIAEVIDADTSDAVASYYGIDPYWLHSQRSAAKTAAKTAAAQSPWLADKLAAPAWVNKGAEMAKGAVAKTKAVAGKAGTAMKDAYTAKAMRDAIQGMGGWKQAFAKGNRLAATKAILKNAWQPGLAYGIPLAAGGAGLAYGLSGNDGITANPYFNPAAGAAAGALLGGGIGYGLGGREGAAIGAGLGALGGGAVGYYGGPAVRDYLGY